MSSRIRTTKARLAAESRYRPDEDHSDLRRDLKVAKLEEHVAKVVAEWPPLTPEQRDRIAILLRAETPVSGDLGGDAA